MLFCVLTIKPQRFPYIALPKIGTNCGGFDNICQCLPACVGGFFQSLLPYPIIGRHAKSLSEQVVFEMAMRM
jgi:hypothetical protein